MLEDNAYYLLLCDIRRSSRRSVNEGTELVRQINAALTETKEMFSSVLKMGPELNYGDEISALVSSPERLYEIMAHLRIALRPYAGLRFACVYGQIGAKAHTLRQVGGPVFKKASQTMAELKKTGWFAFWQISDPETDQVLNSLSNLIDAHIQSMSDYQFDIYTSLADGLSQTEVAEKLDKYQQSVSAAVSRAHIDLILQAEETLHQLLGGLLKTDQIKASQGAGKIQ